MTSKLDPQALQLAMAALKAHPDASGPERLEAAITAFIDAAPAKDLMTSKVIERAQFAATSVLQNWAGDLDATWESYCEAQSTGKHGGRNIKPDQARTYARQFKERAEAVDGCVDMVRQAIGKLEKGITTAPQQDPTP
jgi:hypothetical protein